ncbi:putative baseplate assembly protein W [Aeromonas phage Ahp2]|nr:putative baseplate assembly protein W [Aeromonas phage Ahp2]
MDRETGQWLDGIDSLRQRLADCLSFPKGSLVGRRNYGADLIAILDRTVSPSFTMDVFMTISEAIAEPDNGIPDFLLDQVGISSVGENHIELVIQGTWVPNDEEVTLEGLRIGGN